MKQYPESYKNLSTTQFKQVHLYLCKSALEQLESYVANIGRLKYKNSSSDTESELDLSIPKDAIESVLTGKDVSNVSLRYSKPRSDFMNRSPRRNFDEDMYQLWCSLLNMYEKYIENKQHSNRIIIIQALINCSDADFSLRLEEAIEKTT